MTNKLYINVDAAIVHNNKWLIIRRSETESHAGGKLSLVGGKVDYDDKNDSDSLFETAKREVYEEIGMELIEKFQYVASNCFTSDDNRKFLYILLLCYPKKLETKRNEQEVSEILWMTKDEIMNNINAPGYLKSAIKKASEYLSG